MLGNVRLQYVKRQHLIVRPHTALSCLRPQLFTLIFKSYTIPHDNEETPFLRETALLTAGNPHPRGENLIANDSAGHLTRKSPPAWGERNFLPASMLSHRKSPPAWGEHQTIMG